MQIKLNGNSVEVKEGTTIMGLAEIYQCNPKTILVERNSVALHRSEWNTAIEPQDRIEFIKIVAGG